MGGSVTCSFFSARPLGVRSLNQSSLKWLKLCRFGYQSTHHRVAQLITDAFFSQSQLVTRSSRHTVISSQGSIVQSYG